MQNEKRRVGIVGYGNLGKYLAKAIIEDKDLANKFELAFVWNRTKSKIEEDKFIPTETILENLDAFEEKKADLIIEVAHPLITEQYGEAFISKADFMIGSPTIFANQKIEEMLTKAASNSKFGVYIPAGAFWGAGDIQKMADRGDLKGLKV